MLESEKGEIILLYSTSRQGNNKKQRVWRDIYWGGQGARKQEKMGLFPNVELCEPEQW